MRTATVCVNKYGPKWTAFGVWRVWQVFFHYAIIFVWLRLIKASVHVNML